MSFDWAKIEADVAEQLGGAGVAGDPALALDHARIEAHARAIAEGRVSRAANAVRGRIELAGPDEVERFDSGIPGYAELRRDGEAAIARGEVAVAVLNGGMATR